MDSNISFSSSIYLEQETREDEELSAFTRAVADVFGPQQASLSERDWLDEADSMDTRLYLQSGIGGRSRLRRRFGLRLIRGALAHSPTDQRSSKAS